MLIEVVSLMLMAAGAGDEGRSSARRNSDGDLDRMICRAPEPVLGSRVARRRICRTRAQWQAFEEDRQQLRRDLQNAGACGAAASCTSE